MVFSSFLVFSNKDATTENKLLLCQGPYFVIQCYLYSLIKHYATNQR